RTPSGYRKFYEADIERLRWILRHQRDHFLPLKVMKDRLEESAAAGLMVPPDEPPPAAGGGGPRSLFEEQAEAADARRQEAARPASAATSRSSVGQAQVDAAPPGGRAAGAARAASRPAPTMPPLPAPTDAVNPLDAGPTGVTFSLEE